jgi:hypothetical protein
MRRPHGTVDAQLQKLVMVLLKPGAWGHPSDSGLAITKRLAELRQKHASAHYHHSDAVIPV